MKKAEFTALTGRILAPVVLYQVEKARNRSDEPALLGVSIEVEDVRPLMPLDVQRLHEFPIESWVDENVGDGAGRQQEHGFRSNALLAVAAIVGHRFLLTA